MSVAVRILAREEVDRRLAGIARLRIEIFREWPYLYDGDVEYERRYLRPYVDSSDAVVVGAFDGDDMVGAATGTSLGDHAPEIAEPLIAAGYSASGIFYLAESVLRPAYRGQGVGHAFFDAREARARGLGFDLCAFASVIRPTDHPARPTDPRDLEPFWRGRGYAPIPGAVARFAWRDVGEDEKTEKPLALWIRELSVDADHRNA